MPKANLTKLTDAQKRAARKSAETARRCGQGDDGVCLPTCAKLNFYAGGWRADGRRGFYVRGYAQDGSDIAPYI